MTDFDATVVGAGAVGLSIAVRLAQTGAAVLVLEAADAAGTVTSARNSEVIHAGFYYPTGSLKHRMCVDGRRLLCAYLARRGIAHRLTGKLVVATSQAELAVIAQLADQARDNGVDGVSLIDGAAVARLEPAVSCTGALHSAATGIFDSHGYLSALQADLASAGGTLALRAPFVGASPVAGGFAVRVGGADPTTITTRCLINSAGLSAPDVARRIEGLAAEDVPHLRFAKGSYFALAGRAPFARLVYPAPVVGGLGIHATLDLAGRVRFGPDVEWLPEGTVDPADIDYRVDPERAAAFVAAIRRYWPGLPADGLVPDYSGCRPKLSGPGTAAADFRVDGPERHGLAGLVNLFGIESPGLTSSPALAELALALLTRSGAF